MVRAVAVLATATAALALAACGSDDAGSGTGTGSGTGATQSEDPVRIAYLVATQAAGYPVGMIEAAQAEAQRQNAEIEIFDAQFDPGKQVAQCQDAVTRGTFDAIVALPAASPPMTVCARQAAEADIPLISTNTPIGSDLEQYEPTVEGVTSQVLIPAKVAWGAGEDTGTGQLLPKMCEQVKGECRVAYIQGVQALALSSAALEAVEQIVADHPNMELSGVCVGNYQRAGGLQCMQDLLQKDPDIDVLISQSDDMALGAEQALQEAGKTVGKDVIVGTQGGSVQSVERIRDGRWYGSVLSLAKPEGAIPIRLAAQAARGEEIPASVDPNEEDGLPLVFDQTNKDEFPDFAGYFRA